MEVTFRCNVTSTTLFLMYYEMKEVYLHLYITYQPCYRKFQTSSTIVINTKAGAVMETRKFLKYTTSYKMKTS